MVCKKLKNGKTVENIVEELEAEEGVLRNVVHTAQAFEPDYEEEKIYKRLIETDN